MSTIETVLLPFARTLVPARDGSTPVLSMEALEASRDRLVEAIRWRKLEMVAMDDLAEMAEAAGNLELAAKYTKRAEELHDMWWSMEADSLPTVERDISEWLGIALTRMSVAA